MALRAVLKAAVALDLKPRPMSFLGRVNYQKKRLKVKEALLRTGDFLDTF